MCVLSMQFVDHAVEQVVVGRRDALARAHAGVGVVGRAYVIEVESLGPSAWPARR